MPFTCDTCDTVVSNLHHAIIEEKRYWVCETCRGKYGTRSLPSSGITLILGSDTAGYAGYNNGLGTEVKNRDDWKRQVREKNLRPVG